MTENLSWRIQEAVARKAEQEAFTLPQLGVSLTQTNNSNAYYLLGLMGCVKSVGERGFAKIHDPRNFDHPRLGGKPYPGPCHSCHFTRNNTLGCRILQNWHENPLVYPNNNHHLKY